MTRTSHEMELTLPDHNSTRICEMPQRIDVSKLKYTGRVPNRFGTELSEPKVSECQEQKFFINRIITTVSFPNTTVQSLEFQSSSPPLECPYSMSLARPGFRRIHKMLSFPFRFPCFPFQYACYIDGMEKAYSQLHSYLYMSISFSFPLLSLTLSFPFLVLFSFPFQYAF